MQIQLCENYHHAHQKSHQIKLSVGNWQMKSHSLISLLQPVSPSCLLELAGYLQSDPELHDANTKGNSLGFLAPSQSPPLCRGQNQADFSAGGWWGPSLFHTDCHLFPEPRHPLHKAPQHTPHDRDHTWEVTWNLHCCAFNWTHTGANHEIWSVCDFRKGKRWSYSFHSVWLLRAQCWWLVLVGTVPRGNAVGCNVRRDGCDLPLTKQSWLCFCASFQKLGGWG